MLNPATHRCFTVLVEGAAAAAGGAEEEAQAPEGPAPGPGEAGDWLAQGEQAVDDIFAFKQSQALFPALSPHAPAPAGAKLPL